MSKILTSCDEANHTCDKAQYKEATFLEKVRLNIHLIFCSACREYTKNNIKLSKIIKQKPESLKANDKQSLKSAFEKELQKHQ